MDSKNTINPKLARYAHDGYFLTPEDKITQVGIFFREIS